MRPTLRVLDSVVRAKGTAFIGLGRMGSEMAYNLFSKQYAESTEACFTVCDSVQESAVGFRRKFLAAFPDARVNIVDTPEEAVRSSETVITMLPSSPQVQTVYCEGHGIIPALQGLERIERETRLFIDATTLDVDVARQVAADVILTGAQMIDAPVSGGVTGAQAGTLSFLVGGAEASLEQARPLLALMGRRIIHCGGSGTGLGAKICNNLVLGVQQIVVAEAMLLGRKLGLDPAVLASVINSSTGGCWASSVNNPVPGSLPNQSPPCERGYEGGFSTALMLKDMNLAGNTGPMGDTARSVYAQAVSSELGVLDFSSVYVHLERIR